jgi:hypothetical protein
MVPRLTAAEDLKLRAMELDLARSVHKAPEVVASLAGGLARHSAHQASIIRQALAHMQELECRLALLEPPDTSLSGWMEMAREMRKEQLNGHEIGHDKT